jgi:large subunit ribosomal protein L29
MKIKELKSLSSEELLQKERHFKEQLFEMGFQRQMGRVEKPAMFRSLKRSIARVLTILNERERKDNGKKS